MKKEPKKRFTEEFKKEAVNLVVKQGYTNTEEAQSLGVSESAIRHWKKQFGPKSNKVEQEQQAEIKQLKKEVKRLRMEREILKKAAAFFARETL